VLKAHFDEFEVESSQTDSTKLYWYLKSVKKSYLHWFFANWVYRLC
jgi:hypothetical protein